MKSLKILFVCVPIFLIFIYVFGMSESAGFFSCKNEIVQAVVSPDGQYESLVYYRDCGATTSESTHVGIMEKGLFSKTIDILVIDGKVVVNAEWKGGQILSIQGNGLSKSNDDIYLFESGYQGIEIVYREISFDQ